MGEPFFPLSNPLILLLVVAALGLIPLLVGMSHHIVTRRARSETKVIVSGVAFGAMIFFIIDLFEGASSLGVDFGTRSLSLQMALLATFALGLLAPSFIESVSKANNDRSYESLVYLFALGIGFHSFAEGVVIGYNISAEYGFTLIQRTFQSLSFVLHKGAEGLAMSIPLMFFSARTSKVSLYAILIGGLPLVAGTALSLVGLSGSAASYSFAAGAGGVAYILYRIVRITPAYPIGRGFPLGMLLGVTYLYFAGIIHSVEV